MKRRSFIQSIPLMGLAVAAPVAAPAPETITSRLDRLTTELAQAMGEYQGGKYKAVVEPDGDVHFVRMDGVARVNAAVAELKTAAEALDPSINEWMVKVPSQATAGDWCPLTVTAFRMSGKGADHAA